MRTSANHEELLPDRSSAASIAASAAAGMVGGLVASWLMVKFQSEIWPPPAGDGGESSTTKLARRIAKLWPDEALTNDQAKSDGELIHYALGVGLGLAYGAVAAVKPSVAAGAGIPFGTATEIVFDQTLVPMLGLSNPFWKCPAQWHVRGLAAHLVFGLATDTTRKLLLRLVPEQRA